MSRRGYRAGRLVAMVAVACFALTHAVRLLGAVFPSSVSRRGVAWVVPVPVAAWRVHPRSPASSSQPHRFSFSVVSYRLLVRRSARRPVSSLRLGVPFPLSCPLRHQPRRGESVSFTWCFRYQHAPFFSAHFPICFPLRSSWGSIRANRLTGHRGRRLFHMGHREDGNGKRQGSMKRKTGRDG